MASLSIGLWIGSNPLWVLTYQKKRQFLLQQKGQNFKVKKVMVSFKSSMCKLLSSKCTYYAQS